LHQFKSSMSFKENSRHPTSSLAAGDALVVPHTDPRAWRGVTAAASR
jgi:hypothetical protein